MSVTLRTPEADELPALQALEAAARRRYAAWPGLAFVAGRPPIALERLAAGTVWVADHAGVAAGFILLQPQDGQLYIANISVMPEAGGQGIGAALLAQALGHARALETEALTLTTFRAPPWNGPWFRRHGYTPMPEERMGPALRATLERQIITVDPATREVLWRPVE
ncbi:GNAT family N-acetyltransferase [Nitrospirillum amazonense]|uniref:N-acetylglutamate synthase-like GNAT family acetyltransferase n=1 Tax=Nitrospirillum amazonense TaxID=28077 RepID=A0A560JCB4_9PROT|nr:GNAT family N-acetyltransferase [Nitrospirillum amazonense]MDG3440022.1 GNAT family N-acetyltransferase [Nitrospirillum amazonense]TWB68838.1 N-acetylglutamate synthase-like GNAT family acetyltransferase [Nitrospirillum amazonense]